MRFATNFLSSKLFTRGAIRGFDRICGHDAALALIMMLLSSMSCLLSQAPTSHIDRERLLDVYAQGEANNCGSVATTKFIAATFGIAPATGPFSAVQQSDRSIAVLLADNSTKVFVTEKQLAWAKEQSSFSPQDGKEVAFANLLYAVVAIEMTTQKTEPRVTDGRKVLDGDYHSALATLYDGGDEADADILPLLLGFRFEDHSSNNYFPEVYMLGSSIHIAYVADKLYDEHGLAGGNDVNEFRRRYGERKKEQMYRYFLAEPVGDAGRSIIVRQCSSANEKWTIETANWTARNHCVVSPAR